VISTITAYTAIASFPWNIVVQTVLSLGMGLLATVTWALCGTWLQSLVKSPGAVRAFNIAMAVLLLASLIPVLWEP